MPVLKEQIKSQALPKKEENHQYYRAPLQKPLSKLGLGALNPILVYYLYLALILDGLVEN